MQQGAGRWAGPAFLAVVLLSGYVLFWPTGGGQQPFPAADKVVHLLLFLLLASTARWRFGNALPALALVAVYAVVSEVVQGVALDERSGDPVDVVADLLGAGLGWLTAGRAAASASPSHD